MLLWVIVLLGLGAVVASVRLPRPHHRVALGVAAAALVLLFWPVVCATALASGPAGSSAAESTSCTSATGLRLPSAGGIGIVFGGLVLLSVGSRMMRRRRPPGSPSGDSARPDEDGTDDGTAGAETVGDVRSDGSTSGPEGATPTST